MYFTYYISKYLKQIPPSARDFVEESNILIDFRLEQIYSWKATWALYAF